MINSTVDITGMFDMRDVLVWYDDKPVFFTQFDMSMNAAEKKITGKLTVRNSEHRCEIWHCTIEKIFQQGSALEKDCPDCGKDAIIIVIDNVRKFTGM